MERITIGGLFDHVARGADAREAFVFPTAGARWTYRAALASVQRLAKGLIALGVERGDHVAIWATNRTEWVLAELATATIGAALVPIDPADDALALGYVLEHSDATTLFLGARLRDVDQLGVLAECCPEVRGARPARLSSRRFPFLKRVLLLDDHGAPGVLAWSEVLAASAGITDHMLRRRQERVAPDDVAAVHYTAGTAEAPKGAELTHASLVTTAHYAGECMRLSARDRVCMPLPFHHGLGSVLGTLATLCRGATMVVPADLFDAERTLAAIADERCTALHGVPTMFRAVLAHRRFPAFDLASLRTGVMAGAPCSLELMQQVVGRMHCRELTVAYGETEAPVITQTRSEDPLELRAATVGRALPHVEVKIADERGRELPRGAQGELWCRGYPVMRGYYRLADATAIDGDGWLHTGDVATMDAHGYCRLVGRVHPTLLCAGEPVDAAEIEALLRTHRKIRDAQVFAVGDPGVGEELAVWIRLREGETASPDEIRDFCRARLAYFKVPRYVRFVDAYPTTITGTAQKFRMRELMMEELKLRSAG